MDTQDGVSGGIRAFCGCNGQSYNSRRFISIASYRMILIIDNYDSFTYNLVQRFGELGGQLEVYRNDQTTLNEIETRKADHIVISPGPCTPKEGGISNDVIRHFSGRIPILGVCLGHQCIGYSFGANVVRAERLMHGKTSNIVHDGKSVFAGLDNPFVATRYHSLVIEPGSLPDTFEVTAHAEDDESEIMGVRHKEALVEGVQFHPESFLSEAGYQLLENFMKLAY
jgi:anthranilate synthase/aminodeoxychorismate synthase-like glutamine amidotransferase